MKTFILFFTSFLLFSLWGCETDPIIFKGPYFVRFTEAEGFSKESNTETILIETHMAGPVQDEDVVVHYSISGNAREGIDYEILGTRGEVTIEAGEYFGTIELNLINNANNILRTQDVVFTLQYSDEETLQIGQGESAIGKTFTYTIIDDCILGGTFKAKRGSTTYNGISITSQDCEVYTVSNWNINLSSILDTSQEMDLTFIDNGDNTITIPEQEEENLDAEVATISGIGTVDPITRVITLTITLEDFPNEEPVTITYTPQ